MSRSTRYRGGGSSGGVTGNVAWGPDFGEGAGSDGSSDIGTGVSTGFPGVALQGNGGVGVRPQMTSLVLGSQSTGAAGVATDLSSVNLAGGSAAGVNVDLLAVGLSGGAATGVNTGLSAVGLLGGSAAGCHCAGSVLGAPFWQSVGLTHVNSALGSTTVVIPNPSGLAVGDLMVAAVSCNSAIRTVTPPAEWSSILTTHGTGVSISTFSKIATSGDVAATTFTFTWDSNVTSGVGEIHRVIGVDPTTPVNVSVAGTGSGTTITAPTVTTTVANCLVFCLSVHAHLVGSETHTPPAGHVELTDRDDGATTLSIGQTSDTRVFAPVGATGTAAIACTVLSATNYASQRIAVAPGTLVIAS